MNRQCTDKRTCFSLQEHCPQPLPTLQRKRTVADCITKPHQMLNSKTVKEKLSSEDIQHIKKNTEEICQQFSIKKINQIRKRIIISNKGKAEKEKIMQSFQPLKKQLQKLKGKLSFYKKQQSGDLDPFSAALKQIQKYKEQTKNKQSTKVVKKSPKKQCKDKLKPISEVALIKKELDFLSVERISIFQNEQKINLRKHLAKDYNTQNNQDSDKYFTLSYGNFDESDKNNFKKQQINSKNNGEGFPIRDGKGNLVNMRRTQNYLQTEQKDHFIKFIKYVPIEKSKEADLKNVQPITLRQKEKREQPVFQTKRKKAFNPPFETYYYRDLIWKVNFTNKMVVETPHEYQHRLKVFIGKGNNSGLVRGLIKRRIWFAVTDKIEQANFVWTQLKNLNYLKLQTDGPIRNQVNSNDNYLGRGIFTQEDSKVFNKYLQFYIGSEQRSDQKLQGRLKWLKVEKTVKCNQIKQTMMHNHLINNYVIGNKKALFHTMLSYYNEINEQIFKYLPLTFHIKSGLEDEQYLKFLKIFYKRAKPTGQNDKKIKNAWIVKPGQNSNRGQGIQVCFNLEDIKSIVKKKQKYADGTDKTYIVQSYIERPLLYKKRKFDLRHYILMTSVNGYTKGYWYDDGYVRTTSSEYTLKENSGKIHLTNDAVQKLLPEYGKYQKGNKISYEELQRYLEKHHKISFRDKIYPKMKKVATDAIRACSGTIDPDKKHQNFQIFGLDFMIDSEFNLWLIQINSNPCLQLSCPLLGTIIPKMLQNVLELTLDAAFPPPVRYTPKGVHYFKNLEQQNKFHLVYDQRIQKNYKCSMDVIDPKMLEEQDDIFQDDGDQWNQDD